MSSARDRRVSGESSPTPPASPHAPAEDGEARHEPGAEIPSPPPDPSAGDEAREEILTALAALAKQLEREHERAAHRERVIDRLHEENQGLRRGELQAVLDPVRAALYRLHDLARREAERWAAPEPPEPAHAAALLAAMADEVADALARTGVERFTVEPGEPYDPVRHRPVAVEPVTDPAADGTVVAVRTDGFERDGRVVRKAEVGVGKTAEPAGPSGPSSPREDGRGETMKPRP